MALKILHISDLHIAGDLMIPTRGFPKRHNPALLQAVTSYYHATTPDYVFVTGDVSTDGELTSLQSANTFLTSQTSGGAVGLNLGKGKYFVTPGNHDRYASRWGPIATQCKNFEKVFGDLYQFQGRPRSVGWMIDPGGLRVRVLTIDSMGDAGWTFAKGRVHGDDIDWLREIYEEDLRNDDLGDLRALLLHHHVAIPDNREFKYLTELKNREDLLEGMLRGDIDAVFFGHEHYKYAGLTSYEARITDRRRRRAMMKNGYRLEKQFVVGMCGTTTEESGGGAMAQNLAWLVTIDKKGADHFQFQFDLLEVRSNPQPAVHVVAGGPAPIQFIRQSCR